MASREGGCCASGRPAGRPLRTPRSFGGSRAPRGVPGARRLRPRPVGPAVPHPHPGPSPSPAARPSRPLFCSHPRAPGRGRGGGGREPPPWRSVKPYMGSARGPPSPASFEADGRDLSPGASAKKGRSASAPRVGAPGERPALVSPVVLGAALPWRSGSARRVWKLFPSPTLAGRLAGREGLRRQGTACRARGAAPCTLRRLDVDPVRGGRFPGAR